MNYFVSRRLFSLAEDQITSCLTDSQDEKYEPNNHKKIIKEDVGDGIELEGNVEAPVKLTDNEAYQLRNDVNVTQQSQQKNAVTDNQQQDTTNNCTRKELGQANTDTGMNEGIHAIMQQSESMDLNREREQLMKENNNQRKEIEDIKNESEYLINQLLHENECLRSEIERVKRENNNCVARDIHQLQQKNINMHMQSDVQQLEEKSNGICNLQLENGHLKSEILRVTQEIINCTNEMHLLQQQNYSMKTGINVKVNQLKEKSNEVHKLQEQNINMQNEMQGLREENNNLNGEILRVEQEINDCAEEIQQLQQQNNNMESNMNIEVGQLEEKSNEVHKLQQQSINMRNEMQGLRQENNNLEGEIVRLEQQIIDCGEEIQQLQQQNSNMEGDINIKVGQLEEKSNKIHKLQRQSITMQIEMQGLREENNNLEGENVRLKQQITDCGEVIQQLQQQNTNMESDINIKVSQLEEKSKEIQRLQQERTEMQNAMQRVQQNKTDMRNRIQRLQNEMEQKLITDSGLELILGEELGRGAYGTVSKGEFYGTQVAVKEYHEIILSPYYMKNLRREINIASQCRHPNLLQFICATKNDKNRLLIVTELMDTTLRTLLEQRASERSVLKPQEIKSISLDVARGLNYLHSQKPNPIIHRDISSANVLLWLESNSVKRAKISDYGAANFMELCNTSNPGAILYAAPEATGAKHGPKVCRNK